jgi:UDP-N-acetylmuramoyl-L-alanyl-D-glutamate--2,6-diaminopimelate ligase
VNWKSKRRDVIALLGKGHEKYQEIAGVKHHFDDLEELKKLLK